MTEILCANQIKRAAELLRKGELVAFPTETVYGLGAHLFDVEALEKLFLAKGRARDNPLIAHLANVGQIEQVARDVPEAFFLLAEHFMPGPLTVVLQRNPNVPRLAAAHLDSVAVRFPKHPIAHALLEEMRAPLAAPSANLSGRPSATLTAHVMQDFEGKIAAVIEGGASPIGIESTVVSLLDPGKPRLLRPGEIPKSALEQVLGCPLFLPQAGSIALSPGMKYRHYAPNARVRLFSSWSALQGELALLKERKVVVLAEEIFPEAIPLTKHNLYAQFREADMAKAEEILVLISERTDEALLNRLFKAATPT